VARRVIDRLVRRVDVVGLSMVPTLAPGQRVTAVRRWRRLRVGDVVVAAVAPPEEFIVKRVAHLDGDGVHLVGDNAGASSDSRDYGAVPSRDVRWIVLPSSMGPSSR
jgi:phage repressor protein C with HTH and peptisase S24 domain